MLRVSYTGESIGLAWGLERTFQEETYSVSSELCFYIIEKPVQGQ